MVPTTKYVLGVLYDLSCTHMTRVITIAVVRQTTEGVATIIPTRMFLVEVIICLTVCPATEATTIRIPTVPSTIIAEMGTRSTRLLVKDQARVTSSRSNLDCVLSI